MFLDVGETLVDETRIWGAWADSLGVPRLTFFAALGVVIDQGRDHREVFDWFRPGIDLETIRPPEADLRASDLYPDAVPCLEALHADGYVVGLAGNQPAWAETLLAGLGLAVDLVASSATWGVEKPSPAFFALVVEAASVPASQVAYVGDRIDNDVVPAHEAGLVSVFVRRGPWALIQERRYGTGPARLVVDSLEQLPEALRTLA